MATRRILLYNIKRGLRRERVFRDRLNPFDLYDDSEFYQRFRFDKAFVQFLINYFGENLGSVSHYHPIDAATKILVTLRYMASNSLQQVVGDIFGLSQSAINKIIWKVIPRIAQQVHNFIQMPTGVDLQRTQSAFMELSGIPGIAGAIDCTHVRVFVSKERESAFMDRKGHTSLNIQAVCDQNYKFIHVYAHWPGSSHDSFILKQSKLYADFEAGKYNCILLGDSGYGNGKPWLLTPFGAPETGPQKKFNYAQKRSRVLIEQTFGQCKRRFRGVFEGFRTSPERAQIATVAAFALHNIAKDRRQPDSFDDTQSCDFLPESDYESELISTDLPNFHDGKLFRSHIVQKFFT